MAKKVKIQYRYFKYKIAREGHLLYYFNVDCVDRYENNIENEYYCIVEATDELDSILQAQPSQIQLQELNKEKFYNSIKGLFDREYKEWQPIKKSRDKELSTLKITIDNITLDANEEAQNRINRILNVANFKFNTMLKNGVEVTKAYNEVYNTKIVWKDSNNSFVELKVGNLALFLQKAMSEMEKLWRSYVLPEF